MKRIISKILKEELDNRISRVDYLNKIVEYLVDDTIINFNENKIRLPFLPSRLTPNLSSIFPTTILTPLYPLFSVRVHHMFSEYCKDTYGLTDDDIKYVWKEYRNIILDKINNKESINESTGRISREDYVDKILDILVEDTILDFKQLKLHFPFTLSPSLPLRFHPSFFSSLISTSLFSKYCKDNYGLTDEEIDYVWNEYKNIILDKINNMGNINESTGKISREDYLNKVVDYLVEDTIFDFKKNEIRYPFLSSSTPLLYPFPPSLLILPSFRNYNKDNYGLTENDIGYVWKEYKNIILDKITEWKNRNLSVDRIVPSPRPL